MLGFLVKTYPKISETFILQEILALQNEPFDIAIFSMQLPTDTKFHRAVNAVTTEANYLAPENWWSFLSIKTHIKLIGTRLWAYLSTLGFIFNRQEGGSLGQFCQAVYFSGLLQEKGIRHLHVHFASEPASLAELVNRLCGITYSISAHAKDIYLQNKSCLIRKISHAQFVVTCTEYNRHFLQSINTSKTPVYKIYHGIDSARVLSVNEQKIPPADHLNILSVGRLREKKGFSTLIAACHLLQLAGYQFQCNIVGYGPDREKLQALIEQFHLQDTVRLLGKLTHDKVVALYRQAAIFALPCLITDEGDRDGIPNVLMEAMTFSIPVISSNISGIPELIKHNQTGLVCISKDHHSLFTALKKLLDSPELRKQLGVAGRNYVTTQFAAHQHIGQLQELLHLAVQQNSDTGRRETFTGEQHG
jgi:glycosyltransferase involved in cell wall biosynthesis